MLERIIAFSIKQKLLVGVMIAALIGAGVYSLTRLPIDAVPDITNNQVQVITQSPNLAPLEIEKYITAPLELATANIPGLVETRSISRFGLSVITLVFKDDVDVYWARAQVSERLTEAKELIPAGMGSPSLAPVSTGLSEIFQYTLIVESGYENKYNLMDLRTIQDWNVRRELLRVPGVADVSSFGGYLKQYEVKVNPELLKSTGVTLDELFDALEKSSSNTGAAYLEKADKVFFIRGLGIATGKKDVEQTVIHNAQGVPVLVKDVAVVEDGSSIRYGAMSMDGKGEVAGGILLMLKGENSSEVIRRVKDKIADIQKSLPKGVRIEPFLDREELVSRAIHTVSKNLIEGGLIVIFVLVLLLGNFRAGLIVASVIPLSMLFALCMMVLFGVSGNLMSLGAIDFGLIVDGAVIIVEIVVRKLAEKVKEAKQELTHAVFEDTIFSGAKEIMSSASFGQFIILIVYVPILALAGIEGKMFKPMALTVIFAIAGAFILCLTYVPMMCALFLSRKTEEKENVADRIIHKLKGIYYPALNGVLRNAKAVIAVSFVLLAGAVLLFNQLGGEFIPELNEGDYAIETRMLPGVSLTQSLAVAQQVEKMLLDSFPNEIKKCVSKIGTSEIPTDPMPLEAMDIIVVLKHRDEWKRASSKEELDMLLADALSQFPGVMFSLQQPIQMRFNELMTSAKTDVVVKLYGNDLSVLTGKADEIASIVSRIDGTGDVQVQKVEGLPQIQIEYNRSQLANYGITVQQVNDAIQTSYAGKKAGVIFEEDRRFDLVVRFAEPYRSTIESLNDLMITTQNSQQIPLKEVATIEIKNGPAEIARDNTKRRINIGFNARGRDVAGIVHELQSKVNTQLKLPAGYSLHYGGQFENLAHASKRLGIVLPLALLVIFFLLYLSFHSLKQCLLIFSAIPLAAVGGVVSLWLRDMPFSISAGVGFIALFGVAVLNGIVLIGYLNQLQAEGYDDVMTRIHKALDERFRPVIMTALVASLGFLPMALSHGAGAEVQKPLATVVVGGLITSTLLTLLVLPVLYYITHLSRKPKASKTMLALFLFIVPVLTQAQTEAPTMDFCVKQALQYHPSLKAAGKFIEEQKGAKKAAFNPPTLDVLIQSPTGKDYRPSILQTIDFPMVYARQIQAAGAAVEAAVLKQQLAEIILIRAVKEAYNDWQYESERMQDLQLQDSLFFMVSTASAKRYAGGDIALIERMNAEAAYAIIHQELIAAETRMKNACIRLQAITGLTQLASPSAKQSKAQADSSWLNSGNDKHPGIQLQDALIRSNEKELSAARWRMAPGLSFGYFNQADGNVPNTYRWQFGVRVPVLFWGYTGKIAESKARLEMNRYERSYLLIKQNTEVKEAINQLQASEITLQYYETTGLKQAEELRRVAGKSLASGEIGFTVYANGMERAGRIRIAYLEALKNYNQSVYQLEFLKALVK